MSRRRLDRPPGQAAPQDPFPHDTDEVPSADFGQDNLNEAAGQPLHYWRQPHQMAEEEEGDRQWWHPPSGMGSNISSWEVPPRDGVSGGGSDWRHDAGAERGGLVSPPTIPRDADLGDEFIPAPMGAVPVEGASAGGPPRRHFAPPQDYGGAGAPDAVSQASPFPSSGGIGEVLWFRPIHPGREMPYYAVQQERSAPSSVSPVTGAGATAPQQGSYQTTPFRLRPGSTPSLESAESLESSSFQTPTHTIYSFSSLTEPLSSPKASSISSAQAGSKKKARPPGAYSGSEQGLDEDRSSENKAPLPQNLRGDPFRSAKVKTELCRNFNTEKGCPFGDKCNYAHGEHELKYTKLMDLERAGLVDIEIFRTRPCPAWVATGACPFDQRCIGLHDPRISGYHPSWLPHAETLINSIGSSANIDKLYHQQLAAVYSCSPVYGYMPQRRWKSDAQSTASAWRHFYAFVCNVDESSLQDTAGIHQDHYRDKSAPELCRLAIALKLREQRMAQCYAYLPTHLFCGELCMVLQTRTFRFSDLGGGFEGDVVEEICSDAASTELPSQSTEMRVVEAHEIAFGPAGDPSVRQVSVWFNVAQTDLIPCTLQQAKRHKRSRHRLKKSRQKEKPKTSTVTDSSFQPKSGTQEDTIESKAEPPFYCYQPVDNAAFELVTGILRHRLLMLTFLNCGRHLPDARERFHSLVQEEHGLQKCFESQRRFWMTWAWPVNMGMEKVDNSTDVPPVNGMYHFMVDDEDDFRTEAFHGVNYRGPEVLTMQSKYALGFIWKSFVANIQLDSGARAAWTKEGEMPSHDEAFRHLHRLPIFRLLSMNTEWNGQWPMPLISNVLSPLHPNYQERDSTITIDSLLHKWEIVVSHYDRNQPSPLRSSQGLKDSEGKRGEGTTSPASTIAYSGTLANAAQQWTRMAL